MTLSPSPEHLIYAKPLHDSAKRITNESRDKWVCVRGWEVVASFRTSFSSARVCGVT